MKKFSMIRLAITKQKCLKQNKEENVWKQKHL